jgi:hypothetical protein
MENVAIILKIEGSPTEEMVECVFLALSAQTNINLKVYLDSNKFDKEKYEKELKLLKEFVRIDFKDLGSSDLLDVIDEDYVVYISEKDILYPHFIYTLTKFLTENKDVDVVYGTSFITHVNKDLVAESKRRFHGKRFKFFRLFFGNKVYIHSCMFKKDFLKSNSITIGKQMLIKSALKGKIVYHERDLSERWE